MDNPELSFQYRELSSIEGLCYQKITAAEFHLFVKKVSAGVCYNRIDRFHCICGIGSTIDRFHSI